MTFDDDYPTCLETYATLRIFSDALIPAEITSAVGVSPSESFLKGDPIGTKGHVRRHSGWLLSSRGAVVSRDTRRHLAWLLDQLSSKKDAIQSIRDSGGEVDISCYYVSVGQGGPTMSADQMVELGRLGLDVWWDIYLDAGAESS